MADTKENSAPEKEINSGTEKQLAEIEKDIGDSLEQEEYNLNCARKISFLIGTVSQLKETFQKIETERDNGNIIGEKGFSASLCLSPLIKDLENKIKFYEDKLKEIDKIFGDGEMSSHYFRIEVYFDSYGCSELNLVGYNNVKELIRDCWRELRKIEQNKLKKDCHFG